MQEFSGESSRLMRSMKAGDVFCFRLARPLHPLK
jgi:hypothetical protein